MSVIDELITKFTLQDDYSDKAHRATKHTHEHAEAEEQLTGVHHQLTGATGALTSALGKMSSVGGGVSGELGSLAGELTNIAQESVGAAGETGGLSVAFGMLTAAIAVATVTYLAFIETAKETIPKFAHEDTLIRSFDGFLGSAERAEQMIKHLKEEAMGNPFHFSGLAETAQGLTAMGMDVNRFLPLIERLAGGMGKLSDSGLQDVLEIFRMIQGGRTAMALGPRGLGRFGINRNDLKKQGAQFNGEEFIGTTEQAMDVVERVINSRFAKVFEKMKGGAEAAISDFGDAVHQAEVQAGEGFSESVLPFGGTVAKALRDSVNSGEIKTAAEMIGEALTPVTKAGEVKTLMRESLGYAVGIATAIGYVVAGLDAVSHWLNEKTSEGSNRFMDIGSAIPGPVGQAFTAAKLAGMAGQGSKPGDGGPIDFIKGVSGQEAREEFLKKAQEEERKAKEEAEKGEGHTAAPKPDADKITAQTGYLAQIAANTKRQAEDFSRYAFGHGDVGRAGVTPVEMGALRHGRTAGGHHMAAVSSAVDGLVKALSAAMSDHSAMQRRYGW